MSTLYETDFYSWTQEQADVLRRLPTLGPTTRSGSTGATGR